MFNFNIKHVTHSHTRTWSVPLHIPLPPLYLRHIVSKGAQHQEGRKAALNQSWASPARQPLPAPLTEKKSGSLFLQWTWHGSQGELQPYMITLCLNGKTHRSQSLNAIFGKRQFWFYTSRGRLVEQPNIRIKIENFTCALCFTADGHNCCIIQPTARAQNTLKFKSIGWQ